MPDTPTTSSTALVDITQHAGTQTWRMAHGPVNALNPELLDELEQALTQVEQRDDVSVVVMASDLRVFSAGADASWMAETVAELGTTGLLENFNQTMDRFRAICLRLRRLPALVIAAIDGHCLAGGLELAAACDLRVCSDSEKVQLGVPEMDLFGALPSGGGGVQYLTRLIGPARTLDFVLDATPITPQRAHELGLVERLAPAGQVVAAAETLAGQIADKAGRVGVTAAKQAIYGGGDLPLEQALTHDHKIHWKAMREGNFRSGVAAFVDKFGKSIRS